MAIFALSSSAQSIIGKWVSDLEKDGDGNMVFILNFKDKKNLEIGVECDMNDDDMAMNFSFVVTGTYQLDGDILKLALNTDDMKFDIKKMDFKGELAETIKENPEMKETIQKMVMDAIEGQKNEIVDELPLDGELTISELTDTSLKISEGDEVTSFKRVK